MAFSSIQQIMAQLARQLKERLAGTPAALWNVRGEVAAALPPAEEIEHDVPRVVPEAGLSPSRARSTGVSGTIASWCSWHRLILRAWRLSS